MEKWQPKSGVYEVGEGMAREIRGRNKTQIKAIFLRFALSFRKNLKIFSANNIGSLLVLFCSVFLSALLSVLCFASWLCRGNSA